MPPRKAREEVVLPVEEAQKLIPEAVSEKDLKKLKPKRPISEEQRAILLERLKNARINKQKKREGVKQAKEAEVQRQVDEGKAVRIKIKPKQVRQKREVKETYQHDSSSESSSDSETELSEMPSEVEEKPRRKVKVPKPIKKTLEKIHAVNRQIERVQSDPHGYTAMLRRSWGV